MDERVGALYKARLPILSELGARLEAETKTALSGLQHIDRVAFRVKGTESFLSKAHDRRVAPPYENPLSEIEDQVAGRILVFFLNDIKLVRTKLKGTFNDIERKHVRPSKDEEFSYESYHLICNIPPHLKPPGWEEVEDHPNTFEIQIRTLFMHAYAEPQHNIGYKAASELPPHIRRELAWIAASAWGADQAFMRVKNWDSGARDGERDCGAS